MFGKKQKDSDKGLKETVLMLLKYAKRIIKKLFKLPNVIVSHKPFCWLHDRIRRLNIKYNFMSATQYTTFSAAMKNAPTSYADDYIAQDVLTSMLKVKNGEAAFCEGRYAIAEMRHSYPVLSWLLKIGIAPPDRPKTKSQAALFLKHA
ncbi:hypothetical protein AGMMS49944_32310 [Spirochaetia bacterium]|nr:hypothetical protein AGMMS49944_32310 [Spirochaetia bacterium]